MGFCGAYPVECKEADKDLADKSDLFAHALVATWFRFESMVWSALTWCMSQACSLSISFSLRNKRSRAKLKIRIECKN